MDEAVESDGIFLGRYVLVDYDDAPVKAYGKKDENGVVVGFYNTPHFAQNTRIEPKVGFIYEDLHIETNTVSKFYKWNGASFINLGTDKTPYYESFELDVQKYGRGYDSTVWVKRFDVQTNKYKYAMIAELNAVVPTLHLVVNEPNPTPATPYFDRDTTNIDYYMHMQGGYGNRVKKIANEEVRSDEQVVFNSGHWETDNTGYSVWVEDAPQIVDGDIYYNDAGFDPAVRTFSQGKVTYNLKNDQGELIPNEDGVGNKTATVDYTKNQIGFDFGRSGRYYGANADLGVYSDGHQADDIYDWFIRLPGIGNAICKMWDRVYGYREDNKRHLNSALTYKDSADNLVTYDQNTFAGVINTARDLIGYHFISLDEYTPKSLVTSPEDTITVNLSYDNDIASSTATYKILDCIFYDSDKYYAYKYAPSYGDPVTPNFEDKSKVYYYKENDVYHVANPAAYQAVDANGDMIPETSEYYLATDLWTISPIEDITNNNIYSLIAQIHKMLGTNTGDVRDMSSVQGAINTIKDLIANIDTSLMPGRLLHTNDSGIVETTETYFPSADWDKDELLAGDGTWVSRYASVKVRENSDNSNRKIPKVVAFETTGETTGDAPAKLLNQLAELVSDNQRTQDGTSLVYKQEHDPNTLIFATRDKWIKLHPDEVDDSIEFEHTQSDLVNRLSYASYIDNSEIEIAGPENDANSTVNESNFKANEDGTEVVIVSDSSNSIVYESEAADKNDNRLTIPYITVDNAGHVVAAGTRNYNIPHGFKKVATTTVEDTNESASLDQAGISIAENITDTLNLASRNRWIDIATEANNTAEGEQEDMITWSHRLVPELQENVTLNGDRRTSAEEIPTVYRFGLEADKDIAALDEQNGDNEAANTFNIPYIEIDKAGHVVAAETHTVEIPDGYTSVSIGASISDELTIDTLAKAEEMTADTLTESLVINPSNKWIRLSGENTKGVDTITVGHEIHTITPTTSEEDLDTTASANFTTQVVSWDEAGHIIGHDTKTWTLPDSFHNIKVVGESESAENATVADGTLVADDTFDTATFDSANKWIRLAANEENDTISIGHLTQGTAGSYTGTDLEFTEFGGEVTLYGYETDNAGHIISNPTYTLTLPEGSYEETVDNGANALTTLKFDSKKGELIGTKANVGSLLLTDYTTDGIASAAISASDSLNLAIAKIEAQIKKEIADREAAVSAEANERISADNTLQANIDAANLAREQGDNTLQANIDAANLAREQGDAALTEAINKEAQDRTTAITDESTARANADTTLQNNIDTAIGAEATARSEADAAEVVARNQAIADVVATLWEDLLVNFNLALNAPKINSISQAQIDERYSVKLAIDVEKHEGDVYTYLWSTGETADAIEVAEIGEYTCTVTRNHNGYTSENTAKIEVKTVPQRPTEPDVEEEEEPIE